MNPSEVVARWIKTLLVTFAISNTLILLGINKFICNTVLIVMMISDTYKSGVFKFFFNKAVNSIENTKRAALVNSIASLESYEVLTKKWNNRRRTNLKKLSSSHLKLARKTGYELRIDEVDKAIEINSEILEAVARCAKSSNEVSTNEMRLAVPSESNYRVIEALCHLQRDWTVVGEPEINPIFKYLLGKLESLQLDKSNTAIVIPGSGLGRLAHEASIKGYSEVHAIEYSWLMHLFNEFIYNSEERDFTLYPYIHSYSHHISVEHQIRHIPLQLHFEKPQNLFLHRGDLRRFTIQNSKPKNVVILSEFFIDTAENVFEYLDAFTRIASFNGAQGYWINLGPLKYGSAPKFEPNLEEWRQLRTLYGWKDIDEVNPLEDCLIGYLTDPKSLWQGNYGVGRWASKLDPTSAQKEQGT